jgi:Leucine-rich repeat (LRR) protein
MTEQELLKVIDKAARKGVTSLDLSYEALSSLPAAIGQLTNLQSLYLSNNQLTSLPPAIGQLTNLQSLYLINNQLTSLPPAIGQLTNLQSLYLINNQLTSLPLEIGQLTNLQSLDLSNNQLTSLPPEIDQLTNLQSLDLSNNKLTSLPPEIAEITGLQSLDLSDNRLTSLPGEILKLSQVKINYGNNSLSKIPPEIRRKGWKYVRIFLEQKFKGELDKIYEAKLLIVGEGGAGKTSLAKKIEDETYQLSSNEKSTEGIEIIQWEFPYKENKNFRVNLWDFGGQEIYHATHQFFLTKRSLYILVADSRKEDTDFFYWLRVVELLSESSPILIVKNEKQDRKREINERQLRGEFTNLQKVLATNLETNRGLDDIKSSIEQYITNLPHVGTELPKTWVQVRLALEKDPRNHITQEEYLEICEQNGFTRREDALQLSGYLHDLGVCLHFQEDDLLSKIVILKPTWGTDAVYRVLDNPNVIVNLGKFNRSDLAEIWHEDQYANMYPELLRLMMNFKLCYEIPCNPKTYIAPQLLSPNQPEYPWDEADNLLLRYRYQFMPKGILTRFIVEMHQWIEAQTCVWKTGVVLNKDKTRAEIIEHYYDREIHIRVSGKRCRDLLTTIRYEIDKIHRTYERLKCDTLVPCNCKTCKGSQNPHFYLFEKLQERIDDQRETIECGNRPYLNVLVRSLIDDITGKPIPSEQRETTMRNGIFISYSHQDKTWLDQLQKQLKPLVRNQSIITPWDDTQIQPGAEWRKEIDKALATAKVAILLVSPDFLASDFIANNELPPLLDAAENEGLTIIWIPIRYSSYEETEIAKYQAAHSPSKPLASLSESDRDQAWVTICQHIKTAFN